MYVCVRYVCMYFSVYEHMSICMFVCIYICKGSYMH